MLSATERARIISIVLTERPETDNITVNELVGMGRLPYTNFWGTLQEEDRQIVDDAMQMIGIYELRNRKIGTLSDGEKQKAMIGKAIAQQTPVIILDEPTAFIRIDEQQHHFIGKRPYNQKGKNKIDQHDLNGRFHSKRHSSDFSCPDILSAIGGHRCPDILKDTSEKVLHTHGSSKGCHIDCSQCIVGTL